MNGLFFRTTGKLQSGSETTTALLLNYYKSEEDDYLSTTDLLLNYYWITSEQFSEPFVHPTPLSSCLMLLPTLHGHAINCVPVHRFRIRRTSETGLTPAEWRELPRYALARILMHAVKTEPARFWRVFGWFVACFTGFPSETPWEPLRRCGQRMLCLMLITGVRVMLTFIGNAANLLI